MNIIQVVTRFDYYGGREEYVYNLAINLGKMGHNVTVLSSGKNIHLSHYFIVRNFRVLPLLISKKPEYWEYRIMPMLPFVLMKMNADIIHLHDVRHFTDVVVLISKLKKVPFVITMHYGTYAPTKNLKMLLNLYDRSFVRMIFERAEKIIFVSKGIMNEYRQMFPYLIDKMIVIPNAINVNEYQDLHFDVNDFKRRFNLDESKIILTGGRIIESKGFQYLIQAMPFIIKEEPKVKLIIAGPDRGYKKNLIYLVQRLKLKEHIRFTGMLSHEIFKKLLSIADIFVLPSLYEGLPTILLEAMACGKAIVATNIPAVREILSNEEAVLVKPGDVENLSKAIMMLIQDEVLAKKLGQNARKKSLYYDWNIIAKSIEGVYKSCLRVK
jgi:glycosyltransferase involved in cell wall biosynthesis